MTDAPVNRIELLEKAMPIITKDDIATRLIFQLSSIIDNELSAPLPDGINSEDLVHCLLHAAANLYCKTTISVLMPHDATLKYVSEVYEGMIKRSRFIMEEPND